MQFEFFLNLHDVYHKLNERSHSLRGIFEIGGTYALLFELFYLVTMRNGNMLLKKDGDPRLLNKPELVALLIQIVYFVLGISSMSVHDTS